MTSAESPLTPFNTTLPSEFDLGINLGANEPSTDASGTRRFPLQTNLMVFVWLLVAGLLAMTAIYHVILNAPESRLLAWSASAGAVILLLGAFALKKRAWRFASSETAARASSLLLLAVFTVPTAQLLLTLVATQDLSYTTLVLLLMIGYAMLTQRTQSLFLYITITLAAWSACALRCPAGAWLSYLLPIIGAIGLALFIHSRQLMARPTPGNPTVQARSTKSISEIQLQNSLQTALAERDRAQATSRQLEADLHQMQDIATKRHDFLPLMNDLGLQLAQDVTLQEAGQPWLQRLVGALNAHAGAIWVMESNQKPKLAVGTPGTTAHDALINQAIRSQSIIQDGNCWTSSFDLGLQGRGVLQIDGISTGSSTAIEQLLRSASCYLSLFLRWQLSESEGEATAQDVHRRQEHIEQLQKELATLQESHRQLNEQQTDETNNQTAHWKAEAERWQKLVETAQNEHDTLTQLLDETEQELKTLKSSGISMDRVKELEAKLRTSEADRKSAETSWDAAEKKLQLALEAREKAEAETSEAHAEWEKETQTVTRLNAALRGFTDPVVVFDPSGGILFENDAARKLRGNTRNLPGEHPLWKQAISDAVIGKKQPWSMNCQITNSDQVILSLDISVNPLLQQQKIDSYAIIAKPSKPSVEVNHQPAPANDVDAGPRFFGGLAQTLEPPLSHLIEHADALLDATADQEARRRALVGILQHGRYVHRLLTQACDYAQLESGQAPIVMSSCSPWKLIQQIIANQRPSAEEKGLDLVLQPVSALPVAITTDPDHLTRLLQQLVSQAIRTTFSGAINVKVWLDQSKQRPSGSAHLLFEVDTRDTERQLTHQNSFATDFDLTLSRKQAGAIQSELITDSLSQTRLVLPVSSLELLNLIPSDRLRIEEKDDEIRPETNAELMHGKVLVVVDGQEQQRVTTYQLERLGLRSEVISEATRAIGRINEERFDMVLWDVNKQDMPFIKAAQLLRSHFYDGAIFAVGTPPSTRQRDEFLAAGGDGVLHRPIVPAVWRHALEKYSPTIRQQSLMQQESIPSDYHGDRAFLDLIRNYVAKLPGHLAEMRASLQVADMARLIRLAHALVDGGQLYGYPALSEVAQQLERIVLTGRDASVQTSLLDQLGAIISKIEQGLKPNQSAGYLAWPKPLTKAA